MVRKEEVALLSDDGGGGGGSGTGELSSASTHKRQACTGLLAICVIVALPGAFQFGYASVRPHTLSHVMCTHRSPLPNDVFKFNSQSLRVSSMIQRQ